MKNGWADLQIGYFNFVFLHQIIALIFVMKCTNEIGKQLSEVGESFGESVFWKLVTN